VAPMYGAAKIRRLDAGSVNPRDHYLDRRAGLRRGKRPDVQPCQARGRGSLVAWSDTCPGLRWAPIKSASRGSTSPNLLAAKAWSSSGYPCEVSPQAHLSDHGNAMNRFCLATKPRHHIAVDNLTDFLR
jgi:hypothetical protein